VVNEQLEALSRLIEEEEFGARLTVISGDAAGASAVMSVEAGLVAGSLPGKVVRPAVEDALELIDRETPATVAYGDVEVFIEPVVPRSRLVIFGAVHIAQALSQHGAAMGFHVTVSDARQPFITAERFPHADELAVGWPDQVIDQLTLDRRTAVVVLSHDARFEDPLWPLVLDKPIRYLGAMGSSRTAVRRRERLLRAGFSEGVVDRIHGPIGLDIGAETPHEVAIAILAEIVAEHRRPHEKLELQGERRPLVPAHRRG